MGLYTDTSCMQNTENLVLVVSKATGRRGNQANPRGRVTWRRALDRHTAPGQKIGRHERQVLKCVVLGLSVCVCVQSYISFVLEDCV